MIILHFYVNTVKSKNDRSILDFDLASRPQLFERWIAQLDVVILILWIAIYPVDSAIQLSNNRGLEENVFRVSWGKEAMICKVCLVQHLTKFRFIWLPVVNSDPRLQANRYWMHSALKSLRTRWLSDNNLTVSRTWKVSVHENEGYKSCNRMFSVRNKNAFSMLRGLFPVRKRILSSGEVDFRFSDSRNLAINLKV